MTKSQEVFFKDEIWMLSFAGAFQRNKVYAEAASEKQREIFRNALRSYMETETLPVYKKGVGDSKHSAMIISIIENSKKHQSILNNACLSVGTAQKLLNLALKYYWSLGWLPEPPHFPVDSRIQKCIPAKSRMSWTSISKLSEYQSIIDCVKEQLKEGESLAGWELVNFRRRNSVL